MKLFNRSRLALIALLLVLSTLFASCDFLLPSQGNAPQTTPQETTTEKIDVQEKPYETSDTSSEDQTGTIPTPPVEDSKEFDYNDVPAYAGEQYVKINGGVPYFSEEDYTTDSYEKYSNLDELGRCGVAMACIGKDLMPTEARKDPTYTPTGWVQVKYDVVPGKYLYNRSHLIGWQLTGETNNKLNLMTGTPYFNQSNGMLQFENMVADYIEEETENHVLYRVTPVFIGDDLVARGVLIEAWSVEDNGAGICFNVFVYNVQPGVIIDYATGESRLEGVQEEEDEPVTPEVSEPCDYVASKNSNKFHLPTCSSAKNISENNKLEFHTTREQMIKDGYEPCKKCNP